MYAEQAVDPRYAKAYASGANISASTLGPPPQRLDALHKRLSLLASAAGELASQAGAIAENVLGSEPEAVGMKDSPMCRGPGTLGAIEEQVEYLDATLRRVRQQLNRLSAL